MRIRNITKYIKRFPKLSAIVAAGLLTVVVPLAVHAAWGPDRPTFDYNKFDPTKPCTDPANANSRCGSMNGPVFDSFINTPSYGDERNFTTVSEGDTANWKDSVTGTPGQEVAVRVYVHNNANQTTNDSGVGIAKNTKVRVFVPDGPANGFDVAGYISADNATPGRVYDTGTIANANQAFSLQYVPGSATIYNASHPNGTSLDANKQGDIVKDGVLVGDQNMDGNFPGCFQFASVVIIKLKVVAPQLKFSKQVGIPGDSSGWHQEVTVNRGDTVSWLLSWTNSGTDVLHGVVIRDPIAANSGLSLVHDSITLYTGSFPNGKTLPDTALSSGGANVSDYAPGIGGFIRFRTVVNPPANVCELTNQAFARALNVPEMGSEKVKVKIANCVPTQPTFSCVSLSKTPVGNTGTMFTFTAVGSANGGAVIKSYTYDFGDSTPVLTTDKTTTPTHTYKPGSYLAKVTVNVRVNDRDKTATGPQCTQPITVASQPGPTPTPTPTPTPNALPNTGAGDVAGIFTGTSAFSAAAYQIVARRRNRH